MSRFKPDILVLFYSMYGHVFKMAEAVVDGVEEAGGVAALRLVEELIPEDKWNGGIVAAKELMSEVSVVDIHNDLRHLDGLIVGVPTRFGNMPAQMRNFWDQTSREWMEGTLIGKPAAVFSSTATQHGGQETTIISSMLTLLHHGCVLVGLPYSFVEQATLEEISGGSPYGATTIVGPQGQRWPSANELKLARAQGVHLTNIARKLAVD
jgi:NAD(P)H dehydrogenase (quinone)